MATVLDALVVEFGLDPKSFKKGEREISQSQQRMREGANRTAKDFQQVGKEISEAINRARNAVIGLFTVFTAGRGISGFVRETTEGSSALGRMARDLQISTQALSAWEGVSRRAGNAAGEVSSAFQAVQQQVQSFRMFGTPLNTQVYAALGVNVADLISGRLSNDQLYEQILRGASRRNPGEALSLLQGIGLGQETLNLSRLPEQQRRALLQEQQSRRIAVTPEQVQESTRLRTAFIDLEDQLSSVGRQILHQLSPAIRAALEQFRRFAEWLTSDDLRPVWERVRKAIESFAAYLTSDEFMSDMRRLGDNLSYLAQRVIDLLRWLGLIPGANSGRDAWQNGVQGTSGEPTARDRILSGITGRTPEEQMRMRLEREARERAGAGQPERARVPGGPAAGTVIPNGTAADGENQRIAFEFFRSRGWTAAQAAGLIGHLTGESGQGLDVNSFTADGGGQGAQGIGQWRGSRIDAFRARYGRDPRGAPLEMQLDFVDWELRNTERRQGEILRQQTDPREAADRMYRLYGRPDIAGRYGPPDRTGPRRQASALGVYQRFGTQGPPAPGSTISGTNIPPDPGLITGARGAALRDRPGSSTTTSTSSNEANIGQVTVVTQATDAGGIAKDFAAAVRRSMFVDQATRGLA